MVGFALPIDSAGFCERSEAKPSEAQCSAEQSVAKLKRSESM